MKFCNHCHKLYSGSKCSCRRDNQRERSKKYHDSFYDSPAWRALSRYIRVRDYNMDRLALFCLKYSPKTFIGIKLCDYVLEASTGQIRTFSGMLVVHHIVPREDDKSLQYDSDNLITLNTHVHEYIHQLYATNKEEVQNLLREAVKADLP